jgi:hypothetical protein
MLVSSIRAPAAVIAHFRLYEICTVGLVLAVAAARASDFSGQQGFQFNDANTTLANVSTAALIQQKKAGAFSYNYTTTVGQEVNCNLTISATGNAASPTNSGSGIAPSGILNSGITASTTGNSSSATNTSQGTTGNGTTTGSSTSPLNGGHAANGGTSNLVGQTNTGSNLNSNVSGSSMSSSLGPINANGASIQNAVNTSQSNAGSSILATSNGSSACSSVGGGSGQVAAP